jgi:hypothetical protein
VPPVLLGDPSLSLCVLLGDPSLSLCCKPHILDLLSVTCISSAIVALCVDIAKVRGTDIPK